MVVKELAAKAIVRFRYILLVIYFKLLPVANQIVLKAVLLLLLPLTVF